MDLDITTIITENIGIISIIGIMGGVLLALGMLVKLLRLYLIEPYNKGRKFHEDVLKSRSDVSIAIDRRSNAINDLAQVAKSFGNLEQVNKLQISKDRSKMDMSASYQMAGSLLNQVHLAAEQFPTLQSNEHFRAISQNIEALEKEIRDRRTESNLLISRYNTEIGRFPFVLFSRVLGLHREDYIQLDVKGARAEAVPLRLGQIDSDRVDRVLGSPAPSHALPPATSGRALAAAHAPVAALPPHQPGSQPRVPEARREAPRVPLPPRTPLDQGQTVVAPLTSSAKARFTSGPQQGELMQVGPSTVIGRSAATATLVISHPQISSTHAWIGWNGHALVFIDQDSTNGSVVNGTSVRPHEEVPLRAGDLVTLGRDNSISFVMEQC